MGVLVYIENNGGKIKNPVLQAITLAKDLADQLGVPVTGLSIGSPEESELANAAKYGLSKVLTLSGSDWDMFGDRSYAEAVAEAAEKEGANVIVMAATYNGRSIAPRVSIKRDASLLSAISTLPDSSNGFKALRSSNSGKGLQTISTDNSRVVLTTKPNAYKEKEGSNELNAEQWSFSPKTKGAESKEVVKASNKISITEADSVISGGRGFKGPENWNILEDLATALEAGTACSKPVADMDWRPHHEHVGQTGIQIAPNLYIAIGISGAIQHLAGVNSSKNIVVINTDAEAPFFKIADYGIIGDLFDVVPKLTEAVKKLKAGA